MGKKRLLKICDNFKAADENGFYNEEKNSKRKEAVIFSLAIKRSNSLHVFLAICYLVLFQVKY